MPETDLYLLSASPTLPMPPLGSELDFDLQLTLAPAPTNRIVQGTVFNQSNLPVAGAVVKVLTSASANPVAHTTTNASGQYIINQLDPGTYFITASATNFLPPPVQTFTLPQTGTLNLNITLLPIPPGFFVNAIYGVVKNFLEPHAFIENAIVTVTNIDTTPPTLFATTTTNATGEFRVGTIPPGTYAVQANANGFNVSDLITVPITTASFAPVDFFLTINPNATLGTVSGTITDKTTGLPISGAQVGLFTVAADGTEALISLTLAQASGFYLFVNVQPGLNYKVKSKLVSF